MKAVRYSLETVVNSRRGLTGRNLGPIAILLLIVFAGVAYAEDVVPQDEVAVARLGSTVIVISNEDVGKWRIAKQLRQAGTVDFDTWLAQERLRVMDKRLEEEIFNQWIRENRRFLYVQLSHRWSTDRSEARDRIAKTGESKSAKGKGAALVANLNALNPVGFLWMNLWSFSARNEHDIKFLFLEDCKRRFGSARRDAALRDYARELETRGIFEIRDQEFRERFWSFKVDRLSDASGTVLRCCASARDVSRSRFRTIAGATSSFPFIPMTSNLRCTIPMAASFTRASFLSRLSGVESKNGSYTIRPRALSSPTNEASVSGLPLGLSVVPDAEDADISFADQVTDRVVRGMKVT